VKRSIKLKYSIIFYGLLVSIFEFTSFGRAGIQDIILEVCNNNYQCLNKNISIINRCPNKACLNQYSSQMYMRYINKKVPLICNNDRNCMKNFSQRIYSKCGNNPSCLKDAVFIFEVNDVVAAGGGGNKNEMNRFINESINDLSKSDKQTISGGQLRGKDYLDKRRRKRKEKRRNQ